MEENRTKRRWEHKGIIEIRKDGFVVERDENYYIGDYGQEEFMAKVEKVIDAFTGYEIRCYYVEPKKTLWRKKIYQN